MQQGPELLLQPQGLKFNQFSTSFEYTFTKVCGELYYKQNQIICYWVEA